MERQKRQTEYLRAMGVDLYVQRPASDLVSDTVDFESIVGNGESGVAPQPTQSEHKAKTSPLKPEDLLESKLEADEAAGELKQDIQPEPSQEEPLESEVAVEPLHFLWQQTDSSLMLSVQLDQPTDQQTRLLQAVARSLNPSKLQGGSGKWPLTDAQKTTEKETQQFLSSFVQGRSEQTGAELKLILFGKESQRQFPALDGDFQKLVGKILPGDARVSEFRLVPSLEDMLAEPRTKSLTWHSIRDLANS